jgi:hypothetical protein
MMMDQKNLLFGVLDFLKLVPMSAVVPFLEAMVVNEVQVVFFSQV